MTQLLKREKELELERAAKRQKLNEPGQEVSDLSFEGNKIISSFVGAGISFVTVSFSRVNRVS